jgi:hypothetical protein
MKWRKQTVKLLGSHKELSNELMQPHEELGLVPKDPQTDICDENGHIWELIKDILM